MLILASNHIMADMMTHIPEDTIAMGNVTPAAGFHAFFAAVNEFYN
ncbi:MAG: hypothetical protein RHS_3430 [Robinsoniella sp. RHS]|nr:hypothetical protein [Robinsoniella peoriensis]KLU70753.1 MAG: hypothetical protein RHS_3430 [Robinsoniella sp. RHS]